MVDGDYGSHILSKPWHYEGEIFRSPVKAVAWSPNHEGLLATGGTAGDQIIRIYDFKQSKDVQHTIRCNTHISSLAWRKTKLRSSKDQIIEDLSLTFCEELISTHGQPDCEIKLWQINKYVDGSTVNGFNMRRVNTQSTSSIPLKYWFTKVREWTSHQGSILGSVISPDGKYLATIAVDETIRIWDMFEKVEEDSHHVKPAIQYEESKSCDHDVRMASTFEEATRKRRSNSRKKFER